MNALSLLQIVEVVKAENGVGTCVMIGHHWEMYGARACPRNGGNCSQAAYRCLRCCDFDYGEAGGPGHTDCSDEARCDGTYEADDWKDEVPEEEGP